MPSNRSTAFAFLFWISPLLLLILGMSGVLIKRRFDRDRASIVAAEPSRPARSKKSTSRKITKSDAGSAEMQSVPSKPTLLSSTVAPTQQSSEATPWPNGIFESSLPVHGHNWIDDEVFWKLFEEDIKPAKSCSDEVFLRRLYVDVLGTLPTADEARAFLDDHRDGKRDRLIDEVLQRDEYADYWAMKWSDLLRVKAEFPINLWPHAAQAYHRWIRTAVANNLPYDQFARSLLTASGSNFRNPEVNFYRALQSKEPEAIAEVAALTFMATRADAWPQRQRLGMSQFFSKVGYKPTGEWKEEIVFFDPRKQPSGVEFEEEPHFSSNIVHAMFPTGVRIEIPADQDPREVFADWLVDPKNPWFARAMVNRVWFWLLGRGCVHPVDDVRADNPASNIDLLNALADRFVESGYDVKALIRMILQSSVYQLSSVPATDDPRAGAQFAHYHCRRMDAEVLIDAICQITDTHETYMSIIPEPFTFLPTQQRAISLPDGSITSNFLETFGRPPRDTGLQSERIDQLTPGQALHLLNSNHIRDKIKKGPGIKQLRAMTPWQTAERVYLAVLSRRPTEKELTIGGSLCQSESGTRDLVWALINSDEFIFRH